ncbi:MAG: RHS repeat-associated core domain-containing protein, partial [Verrucomicrobiota bacterium]
RIGSLNIYETDITDAIYTTSVLQSTVEESDPNNEIIKEGEFYRQIKTLQSFADIVTISPTRFEIRFYLPSQVGTKNGNLYTITGTPLQIWVFEKPGTSTAVQPQILISSIKGSVTSTYLFTQDIVNNLWTFNQNNGQSIQTHQTIGTDTSATRQEIYTTSSKQSDNTLKLISKTVETYQLFDWGQEMVSLAQDPDATNLVTAYSYYIDSADTANYSKQKAVVNPDGSWEKYVYYPTSGGFYGREWKTYRPYLSSPATYDQATDTNCKVTEVQYGFYNSIFPEYTSFVKETINGVVTSQKTWQMYEENYTAPNGQVYNTVVKNEFDYYGPGMTQYTWQKTKTYTKIDQGNDLDPIWLQEKTACISYPDGRKEIYWYEPGIWGSGAFTPDINGTAWRETVTHARTTGEIANETTKSVTIRDNLGYLVQEQTQVYTSSGYQVLSQTDYTNNAEGNPTQTMRDGRVIQMAIYRDGQKINETDETGIVTEYTFDDFGNIGTSTKKGVAAGSGYQAQPDIVTTFTYDAAGRQTGQVVTAGSLSQATSSTYDLAGRIASETNQGLTTWHSYWGGGLFHQVTQPNGATQITETYLDGQTKSITGTGIIPQYYTYSLQTSGGQAGYQTTTVNTGSANSLNYQSTTTDLFGRTVLVQKPGFNGTTWQQQLFYNDLGELVKVSQTGQADQLTTYNPVGEVLDSGLDMDGDGQLTPASTDRFTETTTNYSKESSTWYQVTMTKQYLQDGQATATSSLQKTQVGGMPSTVSVDPLGNITTVTTTIDLSSKKVTQTTTTPDSSISAVSTTVNGLLVSQSTHTNSAPTLFQYDALGRQTVTVQPDGTSTSQTYNTNGQVATQTDMAGNVTTMTYYAQTELGAGEPKLVTQPDGTTILSEYDLLGNKTREWGSGTYPVDYEYNALGQRSKMYTYRSLATVGNKTQGDTTTWIYDAATGLLVSKTDAISKTTTYNYYPSGQLKSRVWARGVTTTYGYNNAGDLASVSYSDSTPGVAQTVGRSGPTQITDGSGTRILTSSSLGLPFGASYSAGLLNGLGVSYTYDGLGRMDSITAGGRTTNYAYRSEGRLGTVTHQSSVATYGYKTNSDLIATTTFTAGAGTRLTSTRNYDPFDRMGSVVNTPGTGSGISRTYTYNNRNQRIKSTTTSGENWNYGYNNKGEVTSGVKRNSTNADLLGHSYAYTFDEIGNRMTTTINGKASTYTANSLDQYDQRTIPPFAEVLGSANVASTVTLNNQPVQRQADLFFNQIPVDNSAGAVYLQNVIVGVRNNADANGNDAVQQGAVKKIVPKTPEVFTYDVDGNILSDGRFNYTWDGENRLVKAESLTSVPATEKRQILFVYDGQSRRVSKKVNTWNGSAWVLSDSRRFLYDQFNLLAEINDAGSVIKSYAWGLDLSGASYGAGGVGGLLINGASTASATSFPCYDANGNILAYVLNTGVVTAQFEYGPFGELIRSSGTAPCNFGFSTKYRDNETGLNYYGYRYYSTGLGRWMGRDPIEEQGGLNLYGMVGNDEVNWIDVNGKGPFKDYWLGVLFNNPIFFVNWALGRITGPLTYTESSSGRDKLLWSSLKQSAGYKEMKNDYSSKFCPENGNGAYGHISSYLENFKIFILKFNSANFQIGGFSWRAVSKGKAASGKEKVEFTILNDASIGSLTGANTIGDYLGFSGIRNYVPDSLGPFARKLRQIFIYQEEICCGEQF